MTKKYQCLECRGRCEVECECCGSIVDCDECDGSGLNPEVIDIVAFRKAEADLLQRHGGTCALIQNGVEIGRRSFSESKPIEALLFSDFLIKETP